MSKYLKCKLEELAVAFWAVVIADGYGVLPVYYVPEELHSFDRREVKVKGFQYSLNEMGSGLFLVDGRYFLTDEEAYSARFEGFEVLNEHDPDWKERGEDGSPSWIVLEIGCMYKEKSKAEQMIATLNFSQGIV